MLAMGLYSVSKSAQNLIGRLQAYQYNQYHNSKHSSTIGLSMVCGNTVLVQGQFRMHINTRLVGLQSILVTTVIRFIAATNTSSSSFILIALPYFTIFCRILLAIIFCLILPAIFYLILPSIFCHILLQILADSKGQRIENILALQARAGIIGMYQQV